MLNIGSTQETSQIIDLEVKHQLKQTFVTMIP